MISPARGGALYEQIAGDLRAQITSGELPPGRMLPSERDLCQEHGVSRVTVRRAVDLLEREGLVDTVFGHGVRVRRSVNKEPVKVPRGSEAFSRMPTPEEIAEWDLGPGVPMLVVVTGGRERSVVPADRFYLTFA